LLLLCPFLVIATMEPCTRRIRPALSFVTCVSHLPTLKRQLLASPVLAAGSQRELITVHDCPSAAHGLNVGIDRAKHAWIVGLHQDVVLPRGWDRIVLDQLAEAEKRFGPIGVAGVYGVGHVIEGPGRSLCAQRIGHVVDRGRILDDGPPLPARVAALDELLLIVPRGTPLRFDPALGFHLYGADICLQAAERGLAVVAIEALCYHNSKSLGLPPEFFRSAEVFARKWAHRLPVATPCVIVDRTGCVHILGNALDRVSSMAYALPGG
jgi:Glycosyltransferase like family